MTPITDCKFPVGSRTHVPGDTDMELRARAEVRATKIGVAIALR